MRGREKEMWPGDCLPPSFLVAMHTFPSLLPLIRVSKKYIRTKRCLALETHATQCSTYLESLTVAVTATWSLLNNVKITSFVVLRRPLSPSSLSPRGTLCGACEEAIPMRLGKQAYVCRDCGLVCHKPCHVRVAQHCAETSLPNMEL